MPTQDYVIPIIATIALLVIFRLTNPYLKYGACAWPRISIYGKSMCCKAPVLHIEGQKGCPAICVCKKCRKRCNTYSPAPPEPMIPKK